MSARRRILRCLTAALFAAAWSSVCVAAPAPSVAAPGTAVSSLASPVSAVAGRCGVCHPRERVAFENSVHAREDVRCTSCHGGDDTVLDKAAAHGRGFDTLADRASIPAHCGSCHADVTRMRAYNLPVDQYALYQTSGHGVRLKTGDTRVAVCSDCHGAHEVLPPSDPASRVFVANIPRTCGNCHGDSTLVRQRKIPNVFQEYMGSVHARALFDKGNLRAPTCVSCHGVHGAAPPQTGDVNKVCGQCHTAERRYFMAGKHRDAMNDQKVAECASCHSDHAVEAAKPGRLAQTCGDCHLDDSRQNKLGGALMADYDSAVEEVRKADALIARADRIPLQTDDYKARLEEARTYLREGMTATHSVDPDVVSGFMVRARSVGSEIQTDIQGKLSNIFVEKLLLVVFWFYVLVTAGILRRIRDRRTPKD